MADGVVGVQQASAPDRFIDNSYLINDDATPVYRQRVEDPELMALVRLLTDAFSRFGAAFDATGRMYVALTNPAGTAQNVNAVQSGTWNVTTLTTLTNQSQMGGYLTNTMVFSQMQCAANIIRSGITVS